LTALFIDLVEYFIDEKKPLVENFPMMGILGDRLHTVQRRTMQREDIEPTQSFTQFFLP
jgi:hypothetical protein